MIMNNSNTKTYLLLLTFFIFSCGSDSANNVNDSANNANDSAQPFSKKRVDNKSNIFFMIKTCFNWSHISAYSLNKS